MQKNLYIISDHNLWYGNTAAVSRMNLYAKALVRGGDNVRVFLISVQNYHIRKEFVEVEKNIYTHANEVNSKGYKGNVKRIIGNIKFAINLGKTITSHNAYKVFLIYPSLSLSFTLVLFLLLKTKKYSKLFFEVNEIRKYLLNKSTVSIKGFILHHYIKTKIHLYESIWAYSQGLICISQNIATYVKKINNNIIVIPILSEVNKTFTFTPKNKSKFTILYSGYISVRKENIDVFLRALQRLNTEKKLEWEFILCGKVELYDKMIVEEFINENNLNSHVTYLGELTNKEVVELQRKATLLVLPRKNTLQNYYGFSTKLAEYAVSGTPILMTNTGVVCDYFKDNYNCYMVDGYTSDDFFNKLLYIINQNEYQYKRISENAYKTAEEHFNYSNYSDALKQFLQLENESPC